MLQEGLYSPKEGEEDKEGKRVSIEDVDFELLVAKLEKGNGLNLKDEVGIMSEKDMEDCEEVFKKFGYRTTKVFKGDGTVLGNVYVRKYPYKI